jgi:hypothetical protein
VSNNQKIIDAIDQVIKSKSEKTFLDFKVQWHEKNDTGNSSLVNDILCLCNCDYDEDRYLVIGVANNFFVKGIEADQNRRNVEELTDLTRNFNKHPEIEVQQVDYQKKELDVVIISYHRNHIRPFYIESLSDSQKKVIEKSSYKGLSAGAIYSRNNNTNTPKDSTANKFEIEKMWREHFGIDKSALERFKIYLEKPEDWEKEDGASNYYYKYFPEFRIVINYDWERTSLFLKADANWNNFATMHTVALQYHSTILYKDKSAEIDNYNTSIMHPCHTDFYDNGERGSSTRYLFYYVFEDSFLYRISKFLIAKNGCERRPNGVFCYDISEFNPNGRFIFALKGNDKENYENIRTTINALSNNKNKMQLIKDDPRLVCKMNAENPNKMKDHSA